VFFREAILLEPFVLFVLICTPNLVICDEII